jgi:predicted DNA-binding transcriptional regulator AlpA
MEYEFSLKFKLPANWSDMDAVVERLGEHGCTDAVVGLGQPGYVGLDFVREAENVQSALLSGIDDVKRALPGAQLVEAGPDFVGLTDVAHVVGLSRQNIRKLMVGHHQQFPAPIHSGNPSVWHLAQVLEFLKDRQYAFPVTVFEVARTAMQINIAKEQPLLDHRLAAALEPRLHA